MALIKNIKEIPAFIDIFNISSLDINKERFIEDMLPFFEDLEWDMYEYKRRQVNFLKSCYSSDIKILKFLDKFIIKYYSGNFNAEPYFDLIEKLSNDHYSELKDIVPRRKRRIAFFNVTRKNDSIKIVRSKHIPFRQTNSDFYPEFRDFAPLTEEFSSHPIIIKLITHFANTIFKMKPSANTIQLNCHLVKAISTTEYDGSNSPEGIHQDGMDYILSALIVERENISGGESIIYYPDSKTEIYKKTLQVGEGIFQADSNTDLWHYVTDFSPIDSNKPGVRSTIGFDFKIV